MRKVFIGLLVFFSFALIGVIGYILYSTSQQGSNGTGNSSSSVSSSVSTSSATSSASSSTTSDISVAGCEEVEQVIVIDLPELKAGNCDWIGEQDGGIVAGVNSKVLEVSPPTDINVCSFNSLNINESGEQTIYYDDQFILALNNAILVASYENIFNEYPLMTPFAYRDFRRYTGPNAMVGENISTENESNNPPWCIGEVKGKRNLPGSCVVTKTQTTGPIKLALEDGVARRLAKYMNGAASWKFTVVATGDDDNTIDCRLSAMQVEIAVTGVPANCSCGFTDPVCGDGIIDEGESCDDGNTVDGDGCSSTCQEVIPMSIQKNSVGVQVVDGEIRVDYVIVVENPSTEAVDEITVVDELPTGVIAAEDISTGGTYSSSARTVTWDIGTLEPSESATLSYTAVYDIDQLTVSDGNVTLENSATVYVDGQENDTTTEETEVDLDASAQVVKSATATEDASGNTVVNYTVRVSNTGEAGISGYTLRDIYDSSVQESWISNISNSGVLGGGQIVWSNITIAAGDSFAVTYTITIPAGNEITIQNVATLYDENDEVVDEDGETILVGNDLPNTGIFDDSKTLGLFLVGISLMLFGVLVNRIYAEFGLNWGSSYENKVLDRRH